MTCIVCKNPHIENRDLMLCASCNEARRRAAKMALRPSKKRKPIRKVSEKMAVRLTEYKPLKEQHLKNHPDCQIRLLGCTNRNNTVHHSAKRGKNLNNKETFLTACDWCHHQIEFVLSAKTRREKGLLQ